MVFVAFDAAKTIEDGLFKAEGAFGGEAKTFVEVFDVNSYVTICENFFSGADFAFGHLDFLREELRFFTEVESAPNEEDDDESERDDLEPMIVDVIPSGDGLGSDEIKADILDGLGDGVQKEGFSSSGTGGDDHGDRVDDGGGVEEGLDTDVPNRSDVAVFDIDSAEKKGDTERKNI